VWSCAPRRTGSTESRAPAVQRARGWSWPAARSLVLDEPLDPAGDRLWVASPRAADLPAAPRRFGRPIRYSYTEPDQPLAAYQTVSRRPRRTGRGGGRCERRPALHEALVTSCQPRDPDRPNRAAHRVASAEAHERRTRSPSACRPVRRGQVNAARAAGGRVVAVAPRRYGSGVGGGPARSGAPGPGLDGAGDHPERGVRAVDCLLTGAGTSRPPRHLLMLRALSGDRPAGAGLRRGAARPYLWHEFGDVNLLLP